MAVGQVWHVGTHFSFLFFIYSKNHGVKAEPLNFARSSDITYVSVNPKKIFATVLSNYEEDKRKFTYSHFMNS